MSRRPSPPRDYGYRGYGPPERSSTGNLYPVQPQSSRYAPKYTSPRSSGERVGGSTSGSTTLASIENYDRSGRRVSTYTPAPSSYKDPRGSSGGSNGIPSRRLSLNTAPSRGYEPRYPPSVNHTPTSATRGPERDSFDRGPYYQTPVSSFANRNGHSRQSSSIEDTSRTRQFDERRRDVGYDPPRRRRESLDTERPDRRGYHLSGAKQSRPDERASYEYNLGRERSAKTGEPRYRDRSESLDYAGREKPKPLALEYPGHEAKSSRDAGPPSATRGLERLNGISRSESLRDPRSRSPPVPVARGRGPSPDANEDYPVQRRRRPQSDYYARPPSPTITSPTRNGFDHHPQPASGSSRHDPEIASRGFGLRAPSAEPPLERSDRSGVIPAGVLKQREANAAPRDDDYYADDTRRARPPPDGKYGDRHLEPEPESRVHERRSDHDRSGHTPHMPAEVATAAGGGVAALAAGEYASHRRDKDEDSDERRRRDRRAPRNEQGHSRETSATGQPSSAAMPSRPKDVNHRSSQDLPGASFKNAPITATNDEDDYQARMQRELERLTQAKAGAAPPSNLKPPPQQASRRERSPAAEERSPPRSSARSRYEPQHSRDASRDVSPAHHDDSQTVTAYKPPTVEPVTNEPWSAEPDEMPMSPTGGGPKRVAIVEPPPEEKKPKGILKTRTDPFPTYAPEPREGARPFKGAKIDGAPADATMTRVPKSAYSTTVLQDHSERFDVYFDDAKGFDMICILRVVPKDILDKYRAQSDPSNPAHDRHIRAMKRHKEKEEELERKELEEEEERERQAARDQNKDKDDDSDKGSSRSSRHHRKYRHRSSRHKDDDRDEYQSDTDSEEDRDRPKQKAIEY